MFRFLSVRKGRNSGADSTSGKHVNKNKHLIQCKVVLLDGSDLSVDLSVSKVIL